MTMHHWLRTMRFHSGMLRNMPGQVIPCLLTAGGSCPSVPVQSCQSCSDETSTPRRGRPLLDPDEVYNFNNWDEVPWDRDQEEAALQRLQEQEKEALPQADRKRLEEGVRQAWEEFYGQHGSTFFKERNWLCREFPELLKSRPSTAPGSPTLAASQTSSSAHQSCVPDEGDTSTVEAENVGCGISGKSATHRVLEVGCGTGSSLFPILQRNKNPGLFVYGCDYSAKALEILKSNPAYDSRRCQVFPWDFTDPAAPSPLPDNFLDIIQLVFVLSAVNPSKMEYAVHRLTSLLKPNGLILFRDYGWADLAQLRFKKGHCLDANYYIRGDGTTAYFFREAEVSQLFQGAGLVEDMIWKDRRLQVNRKRCLTMYRVWIQGKFRKPA